MKVNHIFAFKAVLENERRSLIRKIRLNDEIFGITVNTSEDLNSAVQSYIQAIEQNRLSLVEQALKRISKNSYGYCTECEGEISVARLQCQPTASSCLECKRSALREVS